MESPMDLSFPPGGTLTKPGPALASLCTNLPEFHLDKRSNHFFSVGIVTKAQPTFPRYETMLYCDCLARDPLDNART
jgi:hypothetical protein